MFKWVSKLFGKKTKPEKKLGECLMAAESAEQSLIVALTWLSAGSVALYPINDHIDIHITDAQDPEHEGYYQVSYSEASPDDLWAMTLKEFITAFRVEENAMEEVQDE